MAGVSNVRGKSGKEETHDHGTIRHPDHFVPSDPGPSIAQMLAADSTRIERERDVAGRVIGVKKLTFIDTHKITCLLGRDADNMTALNQALMAASVVEIDGDPVSRPVTVLQLEALMTRLDFHGVAAAIEAIGRYTPVTKMGAEGEAQEIKN